ncbi:LysR family transcriptional regulator [Pseudomonas antarctica]|uniref:LysR family transcriptional regulator n=1 Tax=Pseudomonas antarctica TaxID=219572 RepID=UPI0039C19F09
MDRLTSMRVFAKAVELGSFAAAGIDLNMSPQLVGKNILILEEELGVRLLNRTTRRQSLTDIGSTFYERVKIILAEVALADSLVAETRSEPRGRLRISAPATFGISALVPKLPIYLERHPQVQIDLTLSNRNVDIVDDGYDIAFRVGNLADSALIARVLAPYRLVLCAAPAYLERHGDIGHPRDLTRHECLGFSHTALRTHWLFEGPEGRIEVPISGRLMIDSGEGLLAAALGGMGILMQPVELVEAALRRGQLKTILPDFPVPTRPLHVLYPQDRLMTPKLRTFLDFALEAFG